MGSTETSPSKHRAMCVAVGYSGGRDSTALLHATLQAAAPLALHVAALHVHHGLSRHADDWLEHCRDQCERWRKRGLPVGFAFARVAGKPGVGESTEAWARQQRYAALRALALAEGARLVLLAHHRRDQAETLLLQALRAAGVAGLAGMPRCAERDGITWARPWLHASHESIQAYVRRHRLRHLEDDTNSDPRYARNRLRNEVWPVLQAAFPDAEVTLATSAQWAQQAHTGLEEMAAQDLAAIVSARGMEIQGWKRLTPARRGNALRTWLRTQLSKPAPARLVTRLMAELEPECTASWPCPGGRLHLYRGTLSLQPGASDSTLPSRELAVSIRRSGVYALPGWGGRLQVRRTSQGGVPLARLAHLELRPRDGGERFQAGQGRPPRSLKKQYQAASIGAWLREGPLVYSGGQLIFVPALGLDARVLASPGQVQVSLDWLPMGEPGK